MSGKQQRSHSIAVFDSGVGGLTVLRSIRQRMPTENLLYLGDTARLPYGTKSKRSVLRYAIRAAAHLQQHDIKLLVIACNTASAVALAELQESLAPLPVIGVVGPGAQAAVTERPGGRHLVLATDATVSLGAYSREIRKIDSAASVTELACELMVALAEEGWTQGDIAEGIIGKYLQPYLSMDEAHKPESLILGCTHFPILKDAIRAVVGSDLSIVDSANTTAAIVQRYLQDHDAILIGGEGRLQLQATDGAKRFARVGGAFLGAPLVADDIELVDL